MPKTLLFCNCEKMLLWASGFISNKPKLGLVSVTKMLILSTIHCIIRTGKCPGLGVWQKVFIVISCKRGSYKLGKYHEKENYFTRIR